MMLSKPFRHLRFGIVFIDINTDLFYYNRMAGRLSEIKLDEFLSRKYGRKPASAVAQIFNDLGLRLPEEEEWYLTDDVNALAFVNRAGVVIRVTRDTLSSALEHECFMPPLFSRFVAGDQANLRIDILPGGELISKWPEKEICMALREAKTQFKLKGVCLRDWHENNIARIPGHPGQYVLIDPGSVRRLCESVQDVNRMIQRPFGDLQDAFSAAWPVDVPSPKPGLVSKAWEMTMQAKQSGRLRADWETHDYFGTTTAARNYNRMSPLTLDHRFPAGRAWFSRVVRKIGDMLPY
jgi:hypothetical protein